MTACCCAMPRRFWSIWPQKYNPQGNWYPLGDATKLGQISQWLAFADKLTATASVARLHDGLLYENIDVDAARVGGATGSSGFWTSTCISPNGRTQTGFVPASSQALPTLPVSTYVLLSEGGTTRIDHPAIRRWTDRVEQITGFVPRPGIFPAGPTSWRKLSPRAGWARQLILGTPVPPWNQVSPNLL